MWLVETLVRQGLTIPPRMTTCLFHSLGPHISGRTKKANKHTGIRRETPTSGPQPSCGRVPFIPWKMSPADILSNLCGIAHRSGWDVPDVWDGPDVWDSPSSCPWDTSEAYRPPNSFCLWVFLLFAKLAMAIK